MHISKGTRLIEWRAKPSILDDPIVEFRIATNQYSPSDLAILREASKRRIRRYDGTSKRTMRPEGMRGGVPGLKRRITWGPTKESYVQELTAEEAEAILAPTHRDRNEFVDVTPGREEGRGIIIPEAAITFAPAEVFKSTKEALAAGVGVV